MCFVLMIVSLSLGKHIAVEFGRACAGDASFELSKI